MRVLCIPDVPAIDSEVYKRFAQAATLLGSHLEMIAGTLKRAQQVFERSYIVFDEMSDLMTEHRRVVRRRGKIMVWREEVWPSIASKDVKVKPSNVTISPLETSSKRRGTTSRRSVSK